METTLAFLSSPQPCSDVIKVNNLRSPTRQWDPVANLEHLNVCQSRITNHWQKTAEEAKK